MVILACLGPALLTAFCFPGEPLDMCIKKRTASTTTTSVTNKAELRRGNVTCLGIKKDSLAFVGLCADTRRSCKTEVSSRSLDCGSNSFCCKDSIRTNPKTARPEDADIGEIKEGDYEHLNQAGCGSSRVSFVLGGQEAPEGAFPFIVSFTQNISHPREWRSFCGGVLISPTHVLSAAHCFDKLQAHHWDKNVRVRLGVANLQKTKRERKSYAKIEEVIKHPKFKRKVDGFLNPFNDLAVVKLHRVRGSHKTVCLPTKIASRQMKTEEPGVVAGWGSTSPTTVSKPDNLIYAQVNPVQIADCRKKYKEFVKTLPQDVYISNNVICAGDKDTDACSGDSGSPLLWVDDKNRWSVAGIVSFGPSVCGQKVPGAYTRVKSYLGWIQTVII